MKKRNPEKGSGIDTNYRRWRKVIPMGNVKVGENSAARISFSILSRLRNPFFGLPQAAPTPKPLPVTPPDS